MELPHVFTSDSFPNTGGNEQLKLLINKAKTGDQAAFSELYTLFFKKIYRFIFFRVGHKQAAEDLAEDVFIRVWGKMATLQQTESFEGWLYQVARNRIIDYYREKKITVALDEVENTLEYDTNVVDIVNLKQQQAILLKLLKELTPEQQSVIKMKFLEDLDNREIAGIMEKTEGAIRVIQHRAITRLQEMIKKFGDKL